MGFCDSRLADATADTPMLGKRQQVDMRHQRKGKKQQPLTMIEATQALKFTGEEEVQWRHQTALVQDGVLLGDHASLWQDLSKFPR